MAEHKIKIIERAFACSEFEYKDLMESWKQFDTKAQASIAIFGIFSAAVFVFLRNAQFKPNLFEAACLLTSLLSIFVSMWESLKALKVHEISAPPSGAETWRVVRYVNDQEELAQVLESFGDAWVQTNRKLKSSVQEKAECIKSSQQALFLGSVALTVCAAEVLSQPLFRGLYELCLIVVTAAKK